MTSVSASQTQVGSSTDSTVPSQFRLTENLLLSPQRMAGRRELTSDKSLVSLSSLKHRSYSVSSSRWSWCCWWRRWSRPQGTSQQHLHEQWLDEMTLELIVHPVELQLSNISYTNEMFKNNDKRLHFHSGLESFLKFIFLLQSLCPSAYKLYYGIYFCGSVYQRSGEDHNLVSANEP